MTFSDIIAHLDYFDQQLMVAMNYDGTDWADQFWYAFSQKWTWSAAAVVWLVMIVLRYRHNWRALLLVLVMLVGIIAAADQLSSGLIKPLVCRLRPSHEPAIQHLLYYVNGYHGGRYGFVSSHAANSFGSCAFFILLFRGVMLRSTVILWALANCYSRIYLGVHYPGDILCGAIIGTAIGIGGYYLLRWLLRRAWWRRGETPLSREEDKSYSRSAWPITTAVWLTVAFIALSAALRQ